MVLCAIFGCGTRTVRDKGVYMARIPSVVTNQGDEIRILSEERRKKWISAISRKDLTDSILEHGRVCGRHFISGKAAKLWDRYDPDWIPTQNLGHNKCDAAEKLQADLEAAGKRDKRVRDHEMKRVAAENENSSGKKSRPSNKKLLNQGKRSVTFLSIWTQRSLGVCCDVRDCWLGVCCDVRDCWLGVCCGVRDCWLGVCCGVCDCWIGVCCCLRGCGLTWCTTHGLLRLCDKAD